MNTEISIHLHHTVSILKSHLDLVSILLKLLNPFLLDLRIGSEVMILSHVDFVRYRTEAAVRAAGKMGIEGKDYVVQDGDIMHFLFNV